MSVYRTGRQARASLDRGVKSSGARLRSQVAAGQKAAEEILEVFEPVVATRVSQWLHSRLGRRWKESAMEDALSVARVAVLSAVSECKLLSDSYVMAAGLRAAENSVRAIDFTSGGISRPRPWLRVTRVASKMVGEEFGGASLAEAPVSAGELGERLYGHFYDTTYERLAEKNPSWSPDRVASETTRALSRQSIARTCRVDMSSVVASAAGTRSLDMSLELYGGSSQPIDAPIFGDDGTIDASYVVRCLLGEVPEPLGLAALESADGVVSNTAADSVAAYLGCDRPHARAEIRSLRSRMSAPHAHFANMESDLSERFEVERSQACELSASLVDEDHMLRELMAGAA